MARKCVLVIDDEASVRDEFEFALTHIGYEAESAPSGEAGIAKAKERRFDLVFLDLRMPGMDGVDTLRNLHEIHPDLPVYIVTAFQKEYGERLRKAALEGLHFQLADKPLSIEQIQAIARSVLEGTANVDITS